MRVHAVAAAVTMAVGIWLSSGTMVPYGAAVAHPTIVEPCHELVNVDHPHHIAPFLMLAGLDPGLWQGSVVLRRILYPIFAYPFVRAAGFLVGGLIANIILNVGAQLLFARYIRPRFGRIAAVSMLWLLATYPGIAYWAGLPYSYAAIVPATLWCMALLYRLQDAQGIRDIVEASTMMGIAFLAYDLLPFFLPAALLLLAMRRRYVWAGTTAVFAALPTALVLATFRAMALPVANTNTSTYGTIVGSYLHPTVSAEWGSSLLRLPFILANNYVFSNFIFIPLLFVIVLMIARQAHARVLAAPEIGLLIAAGAIFLFNNAAPPYYGWQMRGEWMARLYQPVVVVFLMAIARALAALPYSALLRGAVIIAVVANAAIVLGPVTLTRLGQFAYHKFYAHSPEHLLLENLRKFGRRPLGFCDPSHANDGGIDPNTPFNRPAYMYRYQDRAAQ
jgi:hypothetical protein